MSGPVHTHEHTPAGNPRAGRARPLQCGVYRYIKGDDFTMACTTILVGKNASYDGSTMIARNDDSGSGHFLSLKHN